MSTKEFEGIINFSVDGQPEVSKGVQAILKAQIEAGAPPEELRFQGRFAQDARVNFKRVPLAGGESLSLHPKSFPQFGKTSRGHAYLTATMIYSGDGEAYTFRWVGNAVPKEMLKVAVKHDLGKAVGATSIPLDLSKAEVTPAAKANNNQSRKTYATKYYANRDRSKEPKRPRTCRRVVSMDLAAN